MNQFLWTILLEYFVEHYSLNDNCNCSWTFPSECFHCTSPFIDCLLIVSMILILCFSILINYWPTCCGSCQQMFYRGEMLSVWQYADFFWKLRHKAKLRSQPASFPIFSGNILKMQEKGPAATNWLKMRVIPQRGVGGINQARKTNAHLQSQGLVQKNV